ncbi:unnamed protein product [Sphagnum balticum]
MSQGAREQASMRNVSKELKQRELAVTGKVQLSAKTQQLAATFQSENKARSELKQQARVMGKAQAIDLNAIANTLKNLSVHDTDEFEESKNGAIFQLIADLDSDGSGSVDFGEWLTLLTKRVNDRDTRANINKIFALFDDERTGYISSKNLRRVADELGENITEAEIEELIRRADIDGDGIVSEEEFYTIVTRKIKD